MINFYIAQKTIHSLKVRSNTMLVYYDLCRRANQSDLCWPAKKTIAEDCNISTSSVTRALRALERVGLIITVSRRRDIGNGQTSNYYYVFDTPQTLPEQPESADPAACTPYESDVPIVAVIPEQTPETSVSAECVPFCSLPEKTVMPAEPVPDEAGNIFCVNQKSTLRHARNSHISQPIFDTPPHVTVTPQEGIPEKKVTDNPRKKNIFSQVVKWIHRYKGKSHAGSLLFPAENECL